MPAAAVEAAQPVETSLAGLRRLVGRTRRRLRWSWVGAGAGLAVGLALCWLLGAALLDIIMALPDAGRWVAFLGLCGLGGSLLIERVLKPLFRRMTVTGTALRIEKTVPDMHNRLVTALDLAKTKERPAESEPFFRLIVRQAAEKLAAFRSGMVIDRGSLRRALLWTLVPAGVLAAGWFAAPRFVPPAVQRTLMPWADIPPPSWLTVTLPAGDLAVLRGDPAEVELAVEGGQPETLRLQTTNAAGERRMVAVRKNEQGKYVHRFERCDETVGLRAFAERTYSRPAQLRIVPRPELRGVATRIHPPEYVSELPVRELRAEEREYSALAGSRVEVLADASAEATQAFLPLSEEKLETAWKLDLRAVRWWLQDEPPPGAGPYGNWQFDWSRKHRRTHSHPPQEGEARYGVGFNPPMAVRADDVFVTQVRLDPRHPPKQVMVELNDGRSWNHRAWWGDDLLKKPAGPTSIRMGALPPPGEWTRLEIPAAALGMAGKSARELAFVVHGGRVQWDWFGACTGRAEQHAVSGRQRQADLAAASVGTWTGAFAVDLAERYTVQLRDAAGHSNLAPETFRVKPIVDQPPSARVERPGKDILLAKPAPVEISVACVDDVALASAELVVVRQRETKSAVTKLAEWKTLINVAPLKATLALDALDPKPGDVFTYRVKATDRKGQVGESAEYKITIQDSHDAYDKQRGRFEDKKAELAKKVRDLLERQKEVAEKAKEIAAKHEPQQKPEAAKQPEGKQPKDNAKQPEGKQPEDGAKQPMDNAKQPGGKQPDNAKQPDGKQPMDDAKQPDGKQPMDNAKQPDGAKQPKDNAKQPDGAKQPKDNAKQPDGKQPKDNAKQPDAKPQPLNSKERNEVQKLAQREEQLKQEAAILGHETEQLLRTPEAQTATENERQSLQDARQELAKDAAPDLQQAAKELREAAKTPDDAAQTQDAKQAADRAEQDLQRVADKLDRMEKIEKLAKQDTPEAQQEKAELEKQAQTERDARKAADELAELQNRLRELAKEVGTEQNQQEKLAMQAEKADSDSKLRQAESMQKNLEEKAAETLGDVTEALGGKPPMELAKSPEDAAGEPMPGEPKDGPPMPAEPMDGAPKDGASKDGMPPDAAGQPKTDGAPMPGADGQPKEGEPMGGQPKGGSPMGEGKDAQKAGTAGDVPQFETLKKGAATRAGKMASAKAQKGKPAEARKEELGERQDTLRKDLDLAADALERRSGELAEMMKALKGAASDPAAAKAMMESKALQQQRAAAERAGQADPKQLAQQAQQRAQPGGSQPGKGSEGALVKAADGTIPLDQLSKLNLQPREREELLKGSKAPTPDSYKPFVRDYYNRLSEPAKQ